MIPSSFIAPVRSLLYVSSPFAKKKNLPAGKDRTGIAAALLLLVTLTFPLPHRPSLSQFSPARWRLV
jgi:hypothetical protein